MKGILSLCDSCAGPCNFALCNCWYITLFGSLHCSSQLLEIAEKAVYAFVRPTPTAIENNVSEQTRRKSAISGFTFCVPVCFSNSNWKHDEVSFCNFPYRQHCQSDF